MKKWREFFRKGRIAVVSAAVSLVVTLGSAAMVQGAETPVDADKISRIEEVYEQGGTLFTAASQPITKTSQKTTSKKVVLKKASAKTYTKKLPDTKKTSTKTEKKSNYTVKTQTTVHTQVTENYKKESKIKVVNTTITTTVTETPIMSAANPADKSGKYNLSAAQAAPLMDSRVLATFEKLGFSMQIDSTVNYAGYFDAKSRVIICRKADETVYHELGHFLGFISGNMDKSSSFNTVYAQEKNQFTGANKVYATQNSSEYFAESVKDYVLNPSALRSARPQTYAAVEAALAKVTDAQVNKIQLIYNAVWR